MISNILISKREGGDIIIITYTDTIQTLIEEVVLEDTDLTVNTD